MIARLDKLRDVLEAPMLVTSPINVRYLTGLDSTNAAVFVEPDRARLFTDFRYAEKARACEGVDVVQVPRNVFVGIGDELAGRVAFEANHLTYAAYSTLATAGLDLVPSYDVVESIRAVKDDQELAAIRRAAEITSAVYADLAEQQFVGRTELQLAWWIESEMRNRGAEGVAFPVVVAAGPNGAHPHADPGERVIEERQLVVVDAGAKVEGYCSDCTRTFATGELPEALSRAYAICLEAQLKALDAVRVGVAGKDADAVARDFITEHGFGEEFGHGLGHGVGMFIHELPTLRTESADVLEPGNVVTVEPGIYQPGLGGVRIEDLVVVQEDGLEILTSFTKELVTVG